MTSETTRAQSKLNALSSSLDELESFLEPLFSQSLPETVVGLEPLQQAKLQTVLPYLVYDLIFIYLKARGIDPKTHAVVPELDRVRQYFQKISNAENPASRRLVVDKGAAGRMIKHGLARTSTIDPNSSVPDADNQPSTSAVVPKITQKMVEREAYLKRLKEQDANSKGDEDHLEVFDEDTPAEPEPSTSATNAITDQDKSTSKSQKKKKKTSHSSTPKSSTTTTNDPPPSTTTTSTSSKRKRPAIDPFAGYGDDRAPTPPAVDSRDSPSGSVDEAPGSTRKRSAADDGEEVGDSGTPQSSTPGSGKEKKRAKKARKAAS